MAAGSYDKASRYAARIDPPGFLALVLGLPPAAIDFRGWLDTRHMPFPGDRNRTNDTVGRLGDTSGAGPPWAVAVEYQSDPDPDVFGRLLAYLGGLWLGLRPDPERGSRYRVAAAVVNLTGSGSASRRMEWAEAGLGVELRVIKFNLERESIDTLLGGIASGRLSRCVLPWVPLTAGADAIGAIERWKRLAEAETDRRRADYAGLARIFAERAGRKDVWRTQLEG
jgi:hypothetical protein